MFHKHTDSQKSAGWCQGREEEEEGSLALNGKFQWEKMNQTPADGCTVTQMCLTLLNLYTGNRANCVVGIFYCD